MKRLIIRSMVLLVAVAVPMRQAVAEDAIEAYRQLRDTDYIEAVRASDDGSFDVPSTLDEYLTYAMFHNPGLGKEFMPTTMPHASIGEAH